MSLLNYGFTPILKTASATTSGTCHSEQPEGADHAHDGGLSDTDSSDIDSVLPAESDSETVAQSQGQLVVDHHHYQKFQILKMILLYHFHKILV